METRRALVLSAGGQFGAYQIGVWRALAPRWQPDLVVGASIGALNGWMIAAGASADDLERIWREAGPAAGPRWKWPRHWLDGCFDSGPLDRFIQRLHGEWPLRRGFGAVVTELPRLRPKLILGGEAEWLHLAASCSVLCLLPQRRIGGAVYSDGGLLDALPIWAAREMGATEIVAVNVMPKLWWPIRAALRLARRAAGAPGRRASCPVTLITPPESLGGVREAVTWDEGRFARWVAQGERDCPVRNFPPMAGV